MKTTNIQFIDKTDFFTQGASFEVNRSRAKIFNNMCEEIKAHLESGRDTTKASIAKLANIYQHFGNVDFRDFMELWTDEDNADIVFAKEEFCKVTNHYAYIIAFVGRGLSGLEVTIYEF